MIKSQNVEKKKFDFRWQFIYRISLKSWKDLGTQNILRST